MDDKTKGVIENGRLMLKPDWGGWDRENTDQRLGKPAPVIFGVPEGSRTALTDFTELKNNSLPLAECLQNRRSKRKYTDEPLTASELSYLAWAAGGIRETREGRAFRTYPSGGNTQALNLYIYVDNAEGIAKGLYKYLPMENSLLLKDDSPDFKEKLNSFTSTFNAQAVFFWSAVPYRTEYRYSTVSHKMIAIEAGHACQNLYLASESAAMGCVAIAAYTQERADELLGLSGADEFTIYIAAAGK